MRLLRSLLNALKDRYGDGKEPLPEGVRASLEGFVNRSRAIRGALVERATKEQAEIEARRKDVR